MRAKERDLWERTTLAQLERHMQRKGRSLRRKDSALRAVAVLAVYGAGLVIALTIIKSLWP